MTNLSKKNESINLPLPSRWLPYLIAMALFLETLDITILTTSIPVMAQFWSTNPISLKLCLSAYLFSLGIFVPISGWAASRFGFFKVFTSALALFGIGSIICGLSGHLTVLVLGRIIQGIGGAIMMPIGRLILIECYPSDDLLRVTNSVTIPSLLGPVLGPLIGGLIVSHFSWRWIFFVNIPVIVLCIFLSIFIIPSYKKTVKTPLIWTQFLFFCLSMILFTVGNELLMSDLISAKTFFVLLTTGICFFVIYLLLWKRNQNAFLDLNVFKIPSFTYTVCGSFLTRFGVGAIPFLVPLSMQLVFGFSPIKTGAVFSAFGLSMMFMKFFVPFIVRHMGYEKALFTSTFFLGVAMLSFPFHTLDSSIGLIFNLVLAGFFNSVLFSCLNVYAFLKVPTALRASASSIEATIKQVAMGLGVSISAVMLMYFKDNHVIVLGDGYFSMVFISLGCYLLFCSLIFLKTFERS